MGEEKGTLIPPLCKNQRLVEAWEGQGGGGKRGGGRTRGQWEPWLRAGAHAPFLIKTINN